MDLQVAQYSYGAGIPACSHGGASGLANASPESESTLNMYADEE